MNLLKEIKKIAESLREDIEIIPNNPKDEHLAKIMSNMLNYARKNNVDAQYFCIEGHQFNDDDVNRVFNGHVICPYCRTNEAVND